MASWYFVRTALGNGYTCHLGHTLSKDHSGWIEKGSRAKAGKSELTLPHKKELCGLESGATSPCASVSLLLSRNKRIHPTWLSWRFSETKVKKAALMLLSSFCQLLFLLCMHPNPSPQTQFLSLAYFLTLWYFSISNMVEPIYEAEISTKTWVWGATESKSVLVTSNSRVLEEPQNRKARIVPSAFEHKEHLSISILEKQGRHSWREEKAKVKLL